MRVTGGCVGSAPSIRRISGAAAVFAALHDRWPERYPLLLESHAHPPTEACRYHLLLAHPVESRQWQTADAASAARARAGLDALLSATPSAEAVADLPFLGGWFVYLGYEAAAMFEPKLHLPPSAGALPDVLALRCTAAFIFDRLASTLTLVAESGEAELDALEGDLRATQRLPPAVDSSDDEALPKFGIVEQPADIFLDAVRRARDYVAAGDIFQANLSRRWTARFEVKPDPAALYRRLCSRNPSPFAGSMRTGDAVLLSSSPERLLLRDGDRIVTRPIAGTRARLPDAAADAQARAQLRSSAKDRAEHIMLIDLERNDLGRICVPGTIKVDDLLTLESYARVHHLVSGVSGRLRSAVTAVEILGALFPGGTITGCPKLRAMEIITELEGGGRGAYTGSLGYVSRCGRMDFNILIRSLVVHGNVAEFRAGAGIVADSRPESELLETRHKARGLLDALRGAA